MKTLLIFLVLAILLVGAVLLASGCEQPTGIKARESGTVTTAPSDNTGQSASDSGSEWYGSDW